MLEALIGQCRDHKETFAKSKCTLIEENQHHHSDFLVVGWMLHLLAQEQPVTFIAFRENYAHFLSLSKKLGKSIEGYLKTKQLTYIECFESPFCSELPLTESTPQTYASPPSAIRKIHPNQLKNHPEVFTLNNTVVVDALSFWIYEQAAIKSNKMVLGGCLVDSGLASILEAESELLIRMEADVGGYGKLTIISAAQRSNVLYRNVNCRLEFTQHVAI
jgi:hypothetical protein